MLEYLTKEMNLVRTSFDCCKMRVMISGLGPNRVRDLMDQYECIVDEAESILKKATESVPINSARPRDILALVKRLLEMNNQKQLGLDYADAIKEALKREKRDGGQGSDTDGFDLPVSNVPSAEEYRATSEEDVFGGRSENSFESVHTSDSDGGFMWGQ